MESNNVNKKTNRRMNAKCMCKRFLYLMAAFITAMTLAACVEADENEGDENGDNGGQNSTIVGGNMIDKSTVYEDFNFNKFNNNSKQNETITFFISFFSLSCIRLWTGGQEQTGDALTI